MSERRKIVWQPLPGSQALALNCPAKQILYEGSRGPGKTDAQLMFFRKYVGAGYGNFWRGVIFDRQYKHLDDLVAKSSKWFPQFQDGARFHASKGDYRWTWPTGEELLFRQLKDKKDYWGYHGQEFPFIGWNELTKYPTGEAYDIMLSCNRSSFIPAKHSPPGTLLGELPLVVFSTTNAYGAGHRWVKNRFIDPAPPGKIVSTSRVVFNPRTQREEAVTTTQVRIFGSYRENVYLSPSYVSELVGIKNENLRKAWLHGDWNIVAGGALDDVWRESVHVLPRSPVPSGWRIDRSLDWGSSKPFSVGFWAEADGTEMKLRDGRTFCPPRGTLVRVAEWYGCVPGAANEGLKLSAKDVAVGIRARESQWRAQKWFNTDVRPGPADNAINTPQDTGTDSIAKTMADAGVAWEASDKSPGSRKNGLQLVRDRLEASTRGEGPGLYVMDNCSAFISTLPVLPRDENEPDDVDTDAEDHTYDEVRYRVLAGNNRAATKIGTTFTH